MNKQSSTSDKQPSRSKQTADATTDEQQQHRYHIRRRHTAAEPSSSSTHHEKTACPEDLKEEILKEYVSAKKEYDRHVATDGYDYFNLDDAIPPKLEFVPLPPFPQGKEKLIKFDDDRGNVSEVRAITLEKCPDVPQMTYWVNINKNIIGKDELQLHSYPYTADKDAVVDPILNQRLAEVYPEGVHGADVGCEKFMNDWLLYHVATPILKRHKWKNNEELEHLLKTMQQLFPLKGSSKAFMKSYLLSKRRYDPENVSVRGDRIYNDNGKFTAHHSPGVVLSSHRNLMCKKCYSFDCIQHPDGEDDVHIELYDDSDEEESSDDEEACGEDCYKNGNASEETGEWNNQEKTWFDMLQEAGITSSCEISMLFINAYEGCHKTCKEVYAYKSSKEPLPCSSDTKQTEGRAENWLKARRWNFINGGNTRKLQPISNEQRKAFQRAHSGKFNNSRPYDSCKHSGPCTAENDCSCKLSDIVCTKFCGCPTTCESRFPGCDCEPGSCETEKCVCYKASWECDPDLCRSCNCVVGDEPICKNINLQRGLIRKLYLIHSTVVGSGCFTENAIPKDGFIGEYNGEIISSDEAERRGVIADIRKTSYIFKLNEEQCIDAENYGNALRFINHSKNPNCRTKILVVNGVHRIAFFALRDIQAGEELFFNYFYSYHSIQQHEMEEVPQQ